MSDLLDTHYFAYGTLLSSAAMKELCPSATVVAQGIVPHRTLVFRRYNDGVGEGGCSTIAAPKELLIGVVYRITAEEFDTLDVRVRRDLRWFDRLPVEVHTEEGEKLTVSTYHIPEPAAAFAPSEEYTRPIFEGADELALPAWYVRRLTEIVASARETGTP